MTQVRFSKKTKLILILACVGVSLGVVIVSRALYRQVRAPQKLYWKKSNAEIDNLKDPRPLAEKARQGGRYVATEYPPDLRHFNSLTELASGSDAVVIGKAISNSTDLDPSGRTLRIDYAVKIEHVYKGLLTTGETTAVSLPGGIKRFADGTSAEIHTPWLKKMINGGTYLMFLKRSSDQEWSLVGGPRGLFAIPTTSANRNPTSHSLLENDPMRNYDQLDVVAFLRLVRAATALPRSR